MGKVLRVITKAASRKLVERRAVWKITISELGFMLTSEFAAFGTSFLNDGVASRSFDKLRMTRR